MTGNSLSRHALSTIAVAVLCGVLMACKASAPPVTDTAAKTPIVGKAAVQETIAPCANTDKNHPVVCVVGGMVSPKSIRVNDFERPHGGPPSNRPVVIKWRTSTNTGALSVTDFQPPDTCVTQVNCNSNGCTAVVKGQKLRSEGGSDVTCHYTLTLDGVKLDPDIVVDPCCP